MLRSIIGFVLRQMVERPARKATLDQLIANLETHGASLERRLTEKDDAPERREKLRHIIGIERWGHSRLRTLDGAPFTRDEYDQYQPEATQSWPELIGVFRETRAQTLELARKLKQQGVPQTATAIHNDTGPLTFGGWLRYLDSHAGIEAKRMK